MSIESNMKNNPGINFYVKVAILFTVVSFFSLIKNKLQPKQSTNEEIVLIDEEK